MERVVRSGEPSEEAPAAPTPADDEEEDDDVASRGVGGALFLTCFTCCLDVVSFGSAALLLCAVVCAAFGGAAIGCAAFGGASFGGTAFGDASVLLYN